VNIKILFVGLFRQKNHKWYFCNVQFDRQLREFEMETCVEEMETYDEDVEFAECEDEPDMRYDTPVSDVVNTTTTTVTDPVTTEPVSETTVDVYESSFCWMCKFHGNPVCDKAATFVVDSIAHISFQNIINQLFDHLHASFPTDNITKLQISTHIREHMLHPRIKVARMVNRLSEMQSSISQDIVSHDVESEQTIINASAVKLYAVLTNQIASLYKLDEEKLMFRNISMDK
jgi:hypothetical protein